MQANGPQNPYEVWCYQCNVTAPADARRCVHCGERLSAKGSAPVEKPPVDFGGGFHSEVAADESPIRSRTISPMTVIWVVVAIAVSLQRMCN